MSKGKTLGKTFLGLIALGLTGMSKNVVQAAEVSEGHVDQVLGLNEPMERCYGVTKKGQNVCGNELHPCASMAKEDSLPNEWLMLPRGTCEKIVGASTTPKSEKG